MLNYLVEKMDQMHEKIRDFIKEMKAVTKDQMEMLQIKLAS